MRQRFAAPGKRPAERCFPCRAIAADATVAIHARSIPGSENEPPDFGPPLHLHRDAAEAFYVLEGEYLMFIEDEQQLCPPGTFVHVPKNRPHTFKVVSDGPGTKLNLFSPAAMVRYFEELAAAEAAGRVTPELLDGIADRSNVEVLGPVPDTYL